MSGAEMISQVTNHPSPNFGPRPEGIVIDMLVIHYTGMRTGTAALRRLCDPDAEVSAHYLIEEDGRLFRLVDEAERAWHAGVASWRGDSNINDRSIGVELVNPGHDYGYRPFPAAQMAALIGLAGDILARYPILARNVVGHSDVAPTRKQDPGELFDWRALAAAGIGAWPNEPGDGTYGDVVDLLTNIGYDSSDLEMALVAFQRRYLPARVDGQLDVHVLNQLAAVAALN